MPQQTLEIEFRALEALFNPSDGTLNASRHTTRLARHDPLRGTQLFQKWCPAQPVVSPKAWCIED